MSYIYGDPCKARNVDLRLATLKAVSFYLLRNVSTLNQCRKLSCGTVVCKHFAINCFHFWVYPQRLVYIGRHFGTLLRVHLQRLEHSKSLKSRIIQLYGEETATLIRRLETLLTKKSKLLSALTFLLRCRDQNTIPQFLQVKHHINSRAANRIYQRTSLALLRERIHQNDENWTTYLGIC
jgi:hypothetical protein